MSRITLCMDMVWNYGHVKETKGGYGPPMYICYAMKYCYDIYIPVYHFSLTFSFIVITNEYNRVNQTQSAVLCQVFI